MAKARFKLAKLLVTDPHLIVSDTKRDDIGEIILVLSTVYNQLKGVMLLHRLFLREYEAPGKKEISDHSGEYNGIDVQMQAMVISVVEEFFILIQKKSKIIQSKEFNKIVYKLPKKTQKEWFNLVDIALGKSTKDSKFAKYLKLIRNNVGFHFNYDLDQIRNGFIKHFYKDPKNLGNTYAFFSIGGNISNTRFYFRDAAVSGLMEEQAPDNFVTDFFDSIDNINQTVSAIVAIHLKEIGFSEYKA